MNLVILASLEDRNEDGTAPMLLPSQATGTWHHLSSILLSENFGGYGIGVIGFFLFLQSLLIEEAKIETALPQESWFFFWRPSVNPSVLLLARSWNFHTTWAGKPSPHLACWSRSCEYANFFKMSGLIFFSFLSFCKCLKNPAPTFGRFLLTRGTCSSQSDASWASQLVALVYYCHQEQEKCFFQS